MISVIAHRRVVELSSKAFICPIRKLRKLRQSEQSPAQSPLILLPSCQTMESGPEHVGNISPFAHAGSSSSTSAHGILSSPDKPWSVAPEAPAAPFGAPTDDYHSGSSTSHSATASSTPIGIKRVGGKSNVSSACAPCKKSHLACDVARPCQRCVAADRPEQCVDVPVSLLCHTGQR